MKKRLISILLFLCGALWAMPRVYIPAVELLGVHQDYADKIVKWTKSYMAYGGERASFVDAADQSEYTLKIRLAIDSSAYGVVVTYNLLDSKSDEVAWSYSAIAYTPQDFLLVVNEFTQKFGVWSGFKFGAGLGAVGLQLPDFMAAPALSLNAHYMFGSRFLTLDLNVAWKPGDASLFHYGAFLSFAQVFNGAKFHPYVGAGAGYSFAESDTDDYSMTSGGMALLAKAGLIFKPLGSSRFYVLDVRYTYDALKDFYVEDSHGKDITDEESVGAHGFLVTLQVWW